MRTVTYVPLNKIYNREEAFSADLAQNLDILEVGSFEDGEVEARVGTRMADIVAQGDDGVLVIENQFGKADWDHWGRLEAYARLKEANVAALVAEGFEDLMVATCELRNGDSEISWYLLRVRATDNGECVFQTVTGPKIDIQTERSGREYSEFWAPIRESGVFAGKPVPEGDSWIAKGIRGISLTLVANKRSTKVTVYWPRERAAERDQYFERLTELGAEKRDVAKVAVIDIPLMDEGRENVDHWDEIRAKLVETGERVLRTISQEL